MKIKYSRRNSPYWSHRGVSFKVGRRDYSLLWHLMKRGEDNLFSLLDSTDLEVEILPSREGDEERGVIILSHPEKGRRGMFLLPSNPALREEEGEKEREFSFLLGRIAEGERRVFLPLLRERVLPLLSLPPFSLPRLFAGEGEIFFLTPVRTGFRAEGEE